MEPSKSIKQFYDGAEIFITGGSGYIGKVLIEKLLRSCPGIKTIYILMRPKRDSTPLERINKISENMVSMSVVNGDGAITRNQFL